jgi:hypothetical protein
VGRDQMNDRWDRLLAKLEHPVGTYLHMGTSSYSNKKLIIEYSKIDKWYGEQVAQNVDKIFMLAQDIYGQDITLEVLLRNNINLVRKSDVLFDLEFFRRDHKERLKKYYDYCGSKVYDELRHMDFIYNFRKQSVSDVFQWHYYYFDIYCFINIILSRFEVVPIKWLKEWSEYSAHLNPTLSAFDDQEKINVIEIDISKVKKTKVSPLFSDLVKLQKSISKQSLPEMHIPVQRYLDDGSEYVPGRFDILYAGALINISFQILKTITNLASEDIKASIFQCKHEMLNHVSKNGIIIGDNSYDKSFLKFLQYDNFFDEI